MNPAGPESDTESSLMEHLLELRTRLLRALAGLVVVLLALLPFANKLYAWLAQPLLDKLHGMLGASESESRELMRRVKIAAPARRPVPPRWFEVTGSALLKRQRIDLLYFTRKRQTESRREVSPQRLIHYRNTWYLDAWCHASEGLRRNGSAPLPQA